jgi:hypothetical protein
MSAGQTSVKSYGKEADAFLAELYESCGAETTQQKLNVLELRLGKDSNFYAFGGALTDEMKLGCLEYDLLEQANKITLVRA